MDYLDGINVGEFYNCGSSTMLHEGLKIIKNEQLEHIYYDSREDCLRIQFQNHTWLTLYINEEKVIDYEFHSKNKVKLTNTPQLYAIAALGAYFLSVKKFSSLSLLKFNNSYLARLKKQFLNPEDYRNRLVAPTSPTQTTRDEKNAEPTLTLVNELETGIRIYPSTVNPLSKSLRSEIKKLTTDEYVDFLVFKDANQPGLISRLLKAKEPFEEIIFKSKNHKIVTPLRPTSENHSPTLQLHFEEAKKNTNGYLLKALLPIEEKLMENFLLSPSGEIITKDGLVIPIIANPETASFINELCHYFKLHHPLQSTNFFFAFTGVLIPIFYFNRFSSLVDYSFAKRALSSFYFDHEKIRIIEDKELSESISANISIKKPDDELLANLSIYTVKKNTSISLNFHLIELLEILYNFQTTKKLLNNKQRCKAILEFIQTNWSAICSPKQKLNFSEIDKIISVNSHIQSFRELITHLQKVQIPAKSHILVFDEKTYTFQRVHYSTQILGSLFFSFLNKELDKTDIINNQLYDQAVDKPYSQFSKNLIHFWTVCNENNIKLTIDGRSIRTGTVNVNISLEKGSKQDWFELHSDIQLNDYKLKDEHWKAILEGNGTLELDGENYIIDVKSLSTLQKVRALIEKKSRQSAVKGADADVLIAINRLQVFDWLEMSNMGIDVQYPPDMQEIVDSIKNFTRIPKLQFADPLKSTLRDYQKRGIEWLYFLYKHRFGACLADDMGLGKTIQVISLISMIKNDPTLVRAEGAGKCSLIVVPPSLIFNWISEFKKFAPEITVNDYVGSQRSLDSFKNVDIVVTTYDLVRIDNKQLSQMEFHILVFDEAQNLKNLSASRTKAALKLNANFNICLTGTPLENHIGEYYSIMSLAVPGVMEGYREFMERDKIGDTTLVKRAETFLLRRTKNNILKELPDKQESDIYLNMGERQREYYTRFVKAIRNDVQEAYKSKSEAQAGIIALAAITKLRQVCVSPELIDPSYDDVSPKIQFITTKIQELMDEGHAGLLFSQFTKALDVIERQLQLEKIPYVRMDGKTPTAKRRELVRSFQEEDKYPVFLISLKTGGVGLNLTRANYVFHLDPWWNPSVENQASDRAHRMGQKQTVFVQRMLMRNSIEEKMIALKKEKQKLFDEIINSNEKKARSSIISKEQLLDLLS